MSSIASALASSSQTGTSASSSSAAAPGDPLANESTFLTLLVSQLQNQDPLDPTDSNEFVTQLTGYSQLEQMININQNTSTLVTDASGTAAGATTSTGSTNNGTTSTTGN
jgi:flagellar basal-body rod modification protein FlgD